MCRCHRTLTSLSEQPFRSRRPLVTPDPRHSALPPHPAPWSLCPAPAPTSPPPRSAPPATPWTWCTTETWWGCATRRRRPRPWPWTSRSRVRRLGGWGAWRAGGGSTGLYGKVRVWKVRRAVEHDPPPVCAPADGPNDEGEMFERPGKLSDKLPAPYMNEVRAPPSPCTASFLSCHSRPRAGRFASRRRLSAAPARLPLGVLHRTLPILRGSPHVSVAPAPSPALPSARSTRATPTAAPTPLTSPSSPRPVMTARTTSSPCCWATASRPPASR
jgi:hypothetical protein